MNGSAFGKKKKPRPLDGMDMLDEESAWGIFGDYMMGPGLLRFMQAMMNLDDEKFLTKYTEMVEYFKPKISRIEGNREFNTPITIHLAPATQENMLPAKEVPLLEDGEEYKEPEIMDDFREILPPANNREEFHDV